VCLQCYEKRILENGISRESFEDGKIEGMFSPDAYEHGFVPVEDFQDVHITGQDSVDAYCAKAISLIDAGNIVLTDYERLAIGGLEGYVSLYAKKIEA
jgi:hypothetical protein